MRFFQSVITFFRASKRITVFNLAGLSISFAVFIMLAVYLYNEFTFDSYNTRAKELYLAEVKPVDSETKSIWLPNPIGEFIEEQMPEVDAHCTIKDWGGVYSKSDNPESTHKLSLYSVDSVFCEFFTLEITKGNAQPLRGKKSIILSESAAARIFGNEDPIGQVLLEGYQTPFTVEAVYKDFPVNHSFYKRDGFCSFIEADWVNDWSEWSFHTFFAINNQHNISDVEARVNDIDLVKQGRFDDDGKLLYTYHLTPLLDMHFESVLGRGNKKLVLSLLAVSIVLLLMAFVNFLNFSFASLPREARSVALRKLNGASEFNIYAGKFKDTILLSALAFLFGLIISLTIIEFYPNIYNYKLSMNNMWWLVVVVFVSLLMVTGLLSLLPIKVLVRLNPTQALKESIPLSIKKGKKRYVLPVIQYVFAVVLIVVVLMLNKQINFIKHYNLGFEKENVLVLNTTQNIKKQEQAFANELLKNPQISDYAYSQFVPGGVGMGWGREIDGKYVNYKAWPIDERYLSFMGFVIVEGRPFSSNIKADENNFIFNQAAISKFAWDKVIGKKMPGFDFEGEIVGVVKDMKYASLYEEVQPMCFWLTPTRHDKLSLRISGTDVASTIEYIKNTFKQFEGKYPFDYFFLDKKLNDQYLETEKQAQLIAMACMVALIISVIGTLGMASLSCEYRIKEIGVRKTNGASILEILKLINQSFIRQTIVAAVVATPIAFGLASSWLDNFAYKTELNWWIFVVAAALVLFIAVITVSWQSWRAATRNPVEALRYE